VNAGNSVLCHKVKIPELRCDAFFQLMITMFRKVHSRYSMMCHLSLRKCVLKFSRSYSSISEVLRLVQTGKLGSDEAESVINNQFINPHRLTSRTPDETLESFANLDHGRAKRVGFPEAVFAQGKTPVQVAKILDDMALKVNGNLSHSEIGGQVANQAIMATRVSPEQFHIISQIPFLHGTIRYHEMARIITMKASGISEATAQSKLIGNKKVVIACAGTTDLPVAEEAAVTLETAGCEISRVYDAGVAGLYRILNALPILRDPDVGCVIVCAGMDGALPSVVGGLVNVPVIAVPTSVGYGASFGGISAMLTMLNSCSPGVGVVNIDNGFGAAALAYKCISPK
jgi:pyridinium-3,5-biscarboxylic acid mononucleotide synthase